MRSSAGTAMPACCAGDAAAAVLTVVGAGPLPEGDEWVTVTGSYRVDSAVEPVLVAKTVARIPPPDDPYE